MSKKQTVTVRKERHYLPHSELYHAGRVHLHHYEKEYEGRYYSLISSMLMSAFSLEAYLNYTGPIIEKEWKELDRSSTVGKLVHICRLIEEPLDFSKAPFQTIKELFQFRNKLAHPRDEELLKVYTAPLDGYETDFYSELEPKWKEFVTKKNADRCFKDVAEIMNKINKGLPEKNQYPPTISKPSGGSASINSNT